jgi:integrase
MVLFRTKTRLQQDCGHPLSDLSRTAALCIHDHSLAARCSPEAGVRGSGLRAPERRSGGKDPAREGAKRLGVPVGNWLSADQGKRLLCTVDVGNLRGKRDYATLAILLGCGLRRAELATLSVEDIQQREEHWVIADLIGKGGHIRTIPVPDWVKAGIDAWMRPPELRAAFCFARSTKLAEYGVPASAQRSYGAS